MVAFDHHVTSVESASVKVFNDLGYKPFSSGNDFALDGVGPNALVLEVLDDEYGDATAHLLVVLVHRIFRVRLGIK